MYGNSSQVCAWKKAFSLASKLMDSYPPPHPTPISLLHFALIKFPSIVCSVIHTVSSNVVYIMCSQLWHLTYSPHSHSTAIWVCDLCNDMLGGLTFYLFQCPTGCLPKDDIRQVSQLLYHCLKAKSEHVLLVLFACRLCIRRYKELCTYIDHHSFSVQIIQKATIKQQQRNMFKWYVEFNILKHWNRVVHVIVHGEA